MQYRCWRYRFKSEAPSISFVRNADLSGGTLLDIGANRGIYSIYMSRAAGARGRVIAFEPQPELREHLESVRKSFRLSNLTIENVGLSSASGALRMRRPKPGAGAASFHIDPSVAWEEFEVPVVRLDDLVERAGIAAVHLIKCDVESHELEVFKGGEATLRRDLPALIFECNHEIAARGTMFDFLSDLGYDGHFFHITRRDHRSWLHKTRGFYAPASKFADYEYPRPGLDARNYLFLRKGLDPAAVHAGLASCGPAQAQEGLA
jgi:FkbM family methyltransferase